MNRQRAPECDPRVSSHRRGILPIRLRSLFLQCVLCEVVGGVACNIPPFDAITYDPSALAYGLLAHYTFDEGTGTTVADHSGNKRDGTLTNGVWISDGQFGGALHLSGSDFVTVNNFPDVGANYTVSAWVRTQIEPQDGYETVVSTEEAFQGGWQLNLDKTSSAIGIHAAYWDNVDRVYHYYECLCGLAAQWMQIAAVLDCSASTLSLYVDGTIQSVVPATHGVSPGSALFIGRWSGAQRFLVGDIDDVAIYGRALAPAEIAALHRQPPPDP